MKSLKKTLFLLLFCTTFLSFKLSAQTQLKGTELCDSMFKFLKKSNLSPKTQNLVTNGNNSLPYNIILNFDGKDKNSNDYLILVFSIEKSIYYKDLILDCANELQKQSYNSTILLTYGDNQNIWQRGMIFGSDIFIRNLNTNHNNYAVIVNFDKPANNIITGSMGATSPSWMIRNGFKAFTDAKLDSDLPFYYISQISKFNLISDRVMSSFIREQVPSISLNLKTSIDMNPQDLATISQTLQNYINLCDSTIKSELDYHSIMFRIFGRTLWFTEASIIKTIIVSVFLSLLFTLMLGFINKNIHSQTWKAIKKVWFVIPLIFVISSLGNIGGKYLYILFHRNSFFNTGTYTILIYQLAISFFVVATYFFFELFFRKSYTEGTIDFLILISAFMNQYIFSLLDVSLFPLFMLICIISIFSLFIKNNISHIVFMILILLPFIPYINRLYFDSDSNSLIFYLMRSKTQAFIISFAMIPIYLMLFRILLAVKIKFPKKIIFSTILISVYGSVILTFSLVNHFVYKHKQAQNLFVPLITSSNENYLPELEDNLVISYSDTKIFQENVRTINVNSQIPAEGIEVYIKSETEQPVKYSDNDYSADTTTSAVFSIPSYPPQTMSFSYGASTEPSVVNVTAIYFINDQHYQIRKSIILEGKL